MALVFLKCGGYRANPYIGQCYCIRDEYLADNDSPRYVRRIFQKPSTDNFDDRCMYVWKKESICPRSEKNKPYKFELVESTDYLFA